MTHIFSNPFNIAFACDEKWLPHVETAIKSICYHNRNLSFYILHQDISKEWFDDISGKLNHIGNQIHSIQVPPNKFNTLKTLRHISSSSTYFRLMIADILPNFIDTVLYLDSDTIVDLPLSIFENFDFKNNLLAAINDVGLVLKWPFSYFKEKGNYFNAGVLLINLKKWREQNISKELIELAYKQANQVLYGDQCILNMLLRHQTYYLPLRYNLQISYVEEMHKKYQHVNMSDRVNIIHYTSVDKPWQASCPNLFFRNKYWFYRNLEWKDPILLK